MRYIAASEPGGAGDIVARILGPALYRKLGYDPEGDCTPIGLLASNPNVLSVHPSLPATTVAQFIDLAKSRPGQLNYASAGVATSPRRLHYQTRANALRIRLSSHTLWLPRSLRRSFAPSGPSGPRW